MKPFIKTKVLQATGYANKFVNLDELSGHTLKWVKPWGKHFLYGIGDKILKTHFGLFGSYRINEDTGRNPSLKLEFANGIVYFLISSVRELTKEEFAKYDWRVDTMSRQWDEDHVLTLVKTHPNEKLCDLILDQDLFSGAGNIMKNEILFRLKHHPELKVKDLTARQLRKLVQEVRNYAFDFYRWKKKYVLRKNWKVHRQWYCTDCEARLVKKEMGKRNRMTYFCKFCQAKP